MDLFCYLCFVLVMFSFLFILVLRSPAWKELTSWLSCVWCFIAFLSLFHLVSWVGCGALIVSLPDHCLLSYFKWVKKSVDIQISIDHFLVFNR